MRSLLLFLLGAALLFAGCASQQERSISALHHFNKGNEAFHVADFSNAIRHYRMALEWDETSVEIHYNLGLAYYGVDNHKQAVGAFLAALRIDPELADAHYNLALAYDKLFQPDSAHDHYNRYRELAGRNTRDGGQGSTALSSAAGGQTSKAQAAQGNGPGRTPGRSSASADRAGGPKGARAQAGRPRPREGDPITGRQPVVSRSNANGRRAAVGGRSRSNGTNSGDSQKWWIQDRFTRRP